MASMGEALFFAGCSALGAIALAMIIAWFVIPQWRLYQAFVVTPCEVTANPSVTTRLQDEIETYRPVIPIRYHVGDKTYTSDRHDLLPTWYSDRNDAEGIASHFQRGAKVRCWYDPRDPRVVVLRRGHRATFWLVLLLPLAFLVLGLGGLARAWWLSNVSRERRSVLTKIAKDRDPIQLESSDNPQFPSVPRGTDVTNSPGTTLAYRLPIALAPGWKLFAIGTASLAWNGMVVVLVIWSLERQVATGVDWRLVLLMIPFVGAGLWLVTRFVRQWMRTTGIGSTRIEVTDHPWVPGETYELFLAQSGRLDVEHLEMLLVCEEQATFRQGTDAIAETRTVTSESVYENHDFAIRPGEPFQAQFSLRIPANAMHSFRSRHNGIAWKLLVRGRVKRWSAYERSFPVVVVPSAMAEPQREVKS